MKKTRKRVRLMALMALAVVTLLTTVAIAGSPGRRFSFTFDGNGLPSPQSGQKTDAGESTGNYASARVSGIGGISYAHLWVKTPSGMVCTDDQYVDSAGLYELPYTKAVTNGTLYLCASSPSVSGGGMNGTWYP